MRTTYPRPRPDLLGFPTPWGRTDSAPSELAPGVFSVTTPSHGGVLVESGRGSVHFPPAVLLVGAQSRFHAGRVSFQDHNYTPFEEDMEAAVLAYSRPDLFVTWRNPGETAEALRERLTGYVRRWYPNLLSPAAQQSATSFVCKRCHKKLRVADICCDWACLWCCDGKEHNT